MKTFLTVYAEELEKAVREHPDEYSYSVDDVAGVVEIMRNAIKRHDFNKDGRAFRNTCKRLGIKHTYKAITDFIANHQ